MARCGFNPHPPLLAGETLSRQAYRHSAIVSIHTRHYWRVKQHCWLWTGATAASFNPHPPLLAGETATAVWLDKNTMVSIHTRHYWRVKRAELLIQNFLRKFQSTPAITGG